jgi:Rieske Fe-S protein
LLGAAVGLAVAGCSKSIEKWETTIVPMEGDILELDIAKHPELVTPGNMIAVRPESSRDTVLLMRLEGDAFRALSMDCPHLGCTVRWDNEEQRLRCPCHGSRFDDHGKVLQGPAKRGLTEYETDLVGTRLRVRIPA